MVEHNEVTAFGVSNQFIIFLGHPGQNVLYSCVWLLSSSLVTFVLEALASRINTGSKSFRGGIPKLELGNEQNKKISCDYPMIVGLSLHGKPQ